MRAKDLVRFEQYQFSRSRGGLRHRCIVLDPEPNWNLYPVRGRPDLHQVHRYAGGGRVAIALEVEREESTEIDPATGQPWTDEDLADEPYWNRNDRVRTLPLTPTWKPYAARPIELRGLWADELARRAERAEQDRLASIARREREAKEAIEAAERQAAAEARWAEERREKAQANEFYETRLQPVLTELGIDHSRSYGYGTVTLSLEEMHRLLGLIRGGEVTQ